MSDERSRLVIVGAGGFAREIASWVEAAEWQTRRFALVGFVDELSAGRVLRDRPVVGLTEVGDRADVFVVAVGDPALRESLAGRATHVGLRAAPPLLHPSVRYDVEHVTLADGAVICQGCTLTTDIVVGRHVQVNLHCTVGHDVSLGDFATLAPGVHISGKVRVGRGAYLGTGAVTVDGDYERPLTIGASAVVGAGAVVNRSVAEQATVAGVPARVI